MTRYLTTLFGKSSQPPVYHARRPIWLLRDAVLLAQEAETKSQVVATLIDAATFARASIISSFFSIESAANCLLDALKLPEMLEKELERLPTAQKFDLYLRLAIPNAKLDYGSHLLQALQELGGLRHEYVHPKVEKTKLKPVSRDTVVADFGETPKLGIPRDADSWEFEDAVKAFQAATDFLDYFFVDMCKYEKDWTIEILTATREVHLPPTTSYSGEDQLFEVPRSKWGIKMRFLTAGEEPR